MEEPGPIARLVAAAGGEVVLMDGGMGTTLEDRGIPCRTALWSSIAFLTPEGRALCDRIHGEFVTAGARILIANTYNLSPKTCREHFGADAGGRLEELCLAAVESARSAAPPGSGIVVAAGIGSAEGAYATASTHSPAKVRDLLAPPARALVAAGAKTLLFETLTTREEISAVAGLATEERWPAWGAGLTCGPGARTLAGVPVAEAAAILAAAAPEAVFIQCTRYDVVDEALAELVRALAGTAVSGVYANDGRVWRDRRWHGDRVDPETYADAAIRWRDAGARVLGGCCGTGPEHVAELRRRLA